MNLKNNRINTINKINLKSILGRRFFLIVMVIVTTLCMVVLNLSASISPDFVQEELEPGECYIVETTVEIPTMSPSADVDVVFAFDLTISMGAIIDTAKLKTGQIIDNLTTSYPGVSFTFGVMSHMDYPHTYNRTCDYGPAPYGVSSDYAYSLDRPLTESMTAVITAIDSLILGDAGPADGPEDYTRIFYESYADSNIGWRTGAKKLLVNFGDNLPHDCNINEGVTSGTWSTGSDPGRDEIMGTSDDLDLQIVLESMNSSNVTLIECQTNSAYNNYWNYWTGITGGSVHITGSSNLVDDVVNKITSGLPIPKVYNLTLEVTTPGYESWLTSIIPSSYPEVDTGTNMTFEETICVPIDTPPGLYIFNVSAIDGDGINYGNQTIEITVLNNPPVITTDDVTSATEDVFYSVDYDATDPDIGDTLTWSLITDAGFLSMDPDTGVLSGTPDNSDVGSYWVNVSVNDDYGGSDFSNFTLVVLNVNDPPVVSGIPDQTIAEGSTFTTIDLDDYVTDIDSSDAEMTWTYSGNTDLTVMIDANRKANITIPNPDWNGQETITFRATDTGGLWDEDDATFTVTADNDPPVVGDIPDQTVAEGDTFATINLDDYVSDIEDPDSAILWSYSGNIELTVSIVARVATITIPNENWNGQETITFTAEDTGGLTDFDDAIFTVTDENDPPVVGDIPDQTVLEGQTFETINLDDYVEDVEDPDSAISWSYSGNTDLIIDITDRIATITTPNPDWYGYETITFTAEDTGNLTDSDNATFNVTFVNDPPNTPSDPDPDDNDTGVTLNPTLSVYVSDPNGDTMNISFYNAADDSLIGNASAVSSGSNASVTWPNLGYSTPYSWYAVANDSLLENTSDTWSFTTKSSPPPPPPSKKDPTANAGGPYYGFVDEEIEFDGTDSKDNDESGESIEQYDWKFFDEDVWHEDLGADPTHTYNATGDYTVTLKVTDDEGITNTDTATVYISTPSNPPIIIVAEGPTTGDANTTYTYTVNSTDDDSDDTIIYTFNWDDGTDTASDVLASNTSFNTTHNWSTYGVYTVTITAEDSLGALDVKTITVYIDVLLIDDEIIGYLVDEDSDDTYDSFDNTDTGEQADVEKENSTYLIDSNGDGKWDYAYNPDTGLSTYYDYVYQKYYTLFQSEVSTPGFELVLAICAIALILFWKRHQ